MPNNISLIEKHSSVPELPRSEQIFQRAKQIMRQRYDNSPKWLPERQRDEHYNYAAVKLAALDAILPQAESILEELHNLGKPATKTDIAKHLALLVKSFPNAGSADCTVYGRMLCEDVAADQPSASDIEAACRKIRRTSKFLPTISEVLEAIGEAKSHRRGVTSEMSQLIESRDDLLREVDEERERNERHLAERWFYVDDANAPRPQPNQSLRRVGRDAGGGDSNDQT
jgi:hypothetical protein